MSLIRVGDIEIESSIILDGIANPWEIESESNANGSYALFPNGFQVAWVNRFTIDQDGPHSTTNRLNGVWTFPRSFAAIPALFMNVPSQNANRWTGCNREEVISWGPTPSSTTIATANIFFNSGTVSTVEARVEDISLVAIGWG